MSPFSVRRHLGPALLATVVLVAGCAGSGREDAKVLSRVPVAYQPEGFDDLPLDLLRGYRLAADHEPLAVAFAGGALRRFDVVFISTGEEPEDPRRLLDRLAGGLAERGWTRQPLANGTSADDAPERYRKGSEELSLSAEVDSGRTLVTWRLAKVAPPAPKAP